MEMRTLQAWKLTYSWPVNSNRYCC